MLFSSTLRYKRKGIGSRFRSGDAQEVFKLYCDRLARGKNKVVSGCTWCTSIARRYAGFVTCVLLSGRLYAVFAGVWSGTVC